MFTTEKLAEPRIGKDVEAAFARDLGDRLVNLFGLVNERPQAAHDHLSDHSLMVSNGPSGAVLRDIASFLLPEFRAIGPHDRLVGWRVKYDTADEGLTVTSASGLLAVVYEGRCRYDLFAFDLESKLRSLVYSAYGSLDSVIFFHDLDKALLKADDIGRFHLALIRAAETWRDGVESEEEKAASAQVKAAKALRDRLGEPTQGQ